MDTAYHYLLSLWEKGEGNPIPLHVSRQWDLKSVEPEDEIGDRIQQGAVLRLALLEGQLFPPLFGHVSTEHGQTSYLTLSVKNRIYLAIKDDTGALILKTDRQSRANNLVYHCFS